MSDPALMLDTCALIWLVQGSDNLSKAALRRIRVAQTVFVSPISLWEIGLKVARSQLSLPMEPLQWYAKVLEHHDLNQFPLSPSVMVEANQLPWHHRDPADRFIIASAKQQKAPIVTADRKFALYDVEIVC